MITPQNTLFIAIDIQQRLFAHMENNEQILRNMEILVHGALALDLETIVFEQYKAGLGETMPTLRELLKDKPFVEKTSFSCLGDTRGADLIDKANKPYAIIFGIETHVCVMQTALDLLERGKKVYLISDCTSSRKHKDKSMAIRRLSHDGVIITSYEAVLFELLRDAKHGAFKTISKLIK